MIRPLQKFYSFVAHRTAFLAIAVFFVLGFQSALFAQASAAAAHGSKTAKAGFSNEDDIAAKFRAWRMDSDAREWLSTIGYKLADITDVSTSKPHGEKADVVVLVTTAKGTVDHGISIKLVSGTTGFNQIDKRWLRQYAAKWTMPGDVVDSLRLFVGEEAPLKGSRDPKRMFLNELDAESQKSVIAFFEANRETIVSDLLEGDGEDRADLFMIAMRPVEKMRWKLVKIADAIGFFGSGKIEITRAGNLKIGRITMQRKGGDGGRETAKMLQFKVNPTLLFGSN